MLNQLARFSCVFVVFPAILAAPAAAGPLQAAFHEVDGQRIPVYFDPDDFPLMAEEGEAPTSSRWSVVAERGPGLVTHAMVYDPGQRRVLAFGGGGYSHEVWALSLEGEAPRWSLLEVRGEAPCARRSASAIFDPVGRRMIVHGGHNGSFLGDLWELRLEPAPIWSRLDAEDPAPPPLAAAAAVYDPVRRRMLLIQGNDGVEPEMRHGGLWALDLSGPARWSRVETRGRAPAPRSAHSAVYDPPRDRVIVFGGSTAFEPDGIDPMSNEVWELKLGDGAAWHRLDTAEPRPTPREEQIAVYDPVHEQMVIHGGTGGYMPWVAPGDAYKDDVWALSLSGEPRWRQIAGGSPGKLWGHRAVWDPVGERLIAHGGRSTAAPRSVTWALAPDAGEVAAAPAVAQDVPARLKLGVRGPARGTLAFRLFLPAAVPARLELFDVAGRRSAARTLEGLEAGVHEIRWKETAGLPAGIYWLRATSARESATEKVILLQ